MLANSSTTLASLTNAHAGVHYEELTMHRIRSLAVRTLLLAALFVSALVGSHLAATADVFPAGVVKTAAGAPVSAPIGTPNGNSGDTGGPVGLDYLSPTGQFLVSVNFPNLDHSL